MTHLVVDDEGDLIIIPTGRTASVYYDKENAYLSSYGGPMTVEDRLAEFERSSCVTLTEDETKEVMNALLSVVEELYGRT